MKIRLTIIALFSTFLAHSQELESILLAADDAERLTQEYINPALKGIVYSMNDGWYTTGETHKLFGFDITIGANLATVPNQDKTFVFRSADYNTLSARRGDNIQVSTVLGDDGSTTIFDVSVPVGDGTFKVAEFEMPGGIGADFPLRGVPAPVIQFGIGLPTKTDFKLRLVPNLGLDEKVDNFLIGLGLQHDITQYIPGMEMTPFNLSALVAYGHTKVTYAIDDESVLDDVEVRNGEALFRLNTLTVQAIGSIDLKIVDFFASLGFGSGGSRLAMNGDYTLSYDLEDGQGNFLGTIQETISDPLDFKVNVSSMRFGAGMRLNLSIFKIFASYTLQEYSTISAGIALSVR